MSTGSMPISILIQILSLTTVNNPKQDLYKKIKQYLSPVLSEQHDVDISKDISSPGFETITKLARLTSQPHAGNGFVNGN